MFKWGHFWIFFDTFPKKQPVLHGEVWAASVWYFVILNSFSIQPTILYVPTSRLCCSMYILNWRCPSHFPVAGRAVSCCPLSTLICHPVSGQTGYPMGGYQGRVHRTMSWGHCVCGYWTHGTSSLNMPAWLQNLSGHTGHPMNGYIGHLDIISNMHTKMWDRL